MEFTELARATGEEVWRRGKALPDFVCIPVRGGWKEHPPHLTLIGTSLLIPLLSSKNNEDLKVFLLFPFWGPPRERFYHIRCSKDVWANTATFDERGSLGRDFRDFKSGCISRGVPRKSKNSAPQVRLCARCPRLLNIAVRIDIYE